MKCAYNKNKSAINITKYFPQQYSNNPTTKTHTLYTSHTAAWWNSGFVTHYVRTGCEELYRVLHACSEHVSGFCATTAAASCTKCLYLMAELNERKANFNNASK